MKTSLLIISLASATFAFAQENGKSGQAEKNRIETIKIVNGDTVLHEVRVISGSLRKETLQHHEIRNSDHHKGSPGHKKVVVVMDDESNAGAIEEALNELAGEEGVKSENTVRIVKINASDSEDGHAKAIVISKSTSTTRSIDDDGDEDQSDSQKAKLDMEYDNGTLIVTVDLKEDVPCTLKVSNAGNVLLEKSYSGSGEYREKIKHGKEGSFRAELTGKGINLISKIILF